MDVRHRGCVGTIGANTRRATRSEALGGDDFPLEEVNEAVTHAAVGAVPFKLTGLKL